MYICVYIYNINTHTYTMHTHTRTIRIHNHMYIYLYKYYAHIEQIGIHPIEYNWSHEASFDPAGPEAPTGRAIETSRAVHEVTPTVPTGQTEKGGSKGSSPEKKSSLPTKPRPK